MIVDLALSVTGSQLIASALPNVRLNPWKLMMSLTFLRSRRPTRTNELNFMSVSVVTSSLFGVVKPARRSSGFCMSHPQSHFFWFSQLIVIFFSDRMVRETACLGLMQSSDRFLACLLWLLNFLWTTHYFYNIISASSYLHQHLDFKAYIHHHQFNFGALFGNRPSPFQSTPFQQPEALETKDVIDDNLIESPHGPLQVPTTISSTHNINQVLSSRICSRTN
jgi:hypothetical protein